MLTISQDIIDLLNDDIVSHGLLVQHTREAQEGVDTLHLSWKDILQDLLQSEVEIGDAKATSHDYVEFIAWTGSVDQRVSRAEAAVENASASDKEFAYWLCLRKNIDRFENESQCNPPAPGSPT